MKLAVSSYSLSRWMRDQNKSLTQAIAWIGDAGVHGVEFAGLDEKAAKNPVKRARELRRAADKAGLEIPSYCVGAELFAPPAEQHRVVERVKQDVDVAAELGATTMRHDVTRGFTAWSGYKGKQTFAEVLKVVVPAIRDIADYAQARGVKTSLENHGFYLQAPERVEKLIQKVDHPNFGLTIDMGNFLCVDADPVDAVARLAKYAVMAHAKDFHVKPKKQMPPAGWFATPKSIGLRGAIVGHGVVDVPAQLKLLKKAGYNHYLSLEFEGMEEPASAVSLGLDYLRQELTKLKMLSK